MDPVTAFGVATTAYKTIVAGFKVGKQVENMSKDLGRWMGAIQAVKEGHSKKKNRMFGSVEEEALETFAMKKKAIAMENELRTFVNPCRFKTGTKKVSKAFLFLPKYLFVLSASLYVLSVPSLIAVL